MVDKLTQRRLRSKVSALDPIFADFDPVAKLVMIAKHDETLPFGDTQKLPRGDYHALLLQLVPYTRGKVKPQPPPVDLHGFEQQHTTADRQMYINAKLATGELSVDAAKILQDITSQQAQNTELARVAELLQRIQSGENPLTVLKDMATQLSPETPEPPTPPPDGYGFLQ